MQESTNMSWTNWSHGTDISIWGSIIALLLVRLTCFCKGAHYIVCLLCVLLTWQTVLISRRNYTLQCGLVATLSPPQPAQITQWSGGWNTADTVVLIPFYLRKKKHKAAAKVVHAKSQGSARSLSTNKNETLNLWKCCKMAPCLSMNKHRGREKQRQRTRKKESISHLCRRE